jgi:hypothetical protein
MAQIKTELKCERKISSANFENPMTSSNMLRNKITLLAICLALFVVTVCANKRAGMLIDSTIKPRFSALGVPVSESSPQTVRVRLTKVETNADLSL